jgi:hypothetical protein
VVFAAPWTPDPSLVAADGLVAPEFVWSALDCPTGYVVQHDPETGGFNILPILLGRLSVRIDGRPRPGEQCVVTSWKTGSEGRRLYLVKKRTCLQSAAPSGLSSIGRFSSEILREQRGGPAAQARQDQYCGFWMRSCEPSDSRNCFRKRQWRTRRAQCSAAASTGSRR